LSKQGWFEEKNMTVKLHLSDDLTLPLDACTQTFAWIGRKGSGKTYGAGKMVEELLDHNVQTVILDTVGNWYGLRILPDGSKGYEIPVFGGLRKDLPLLATAGLITYPSSGKVQLTDAGRALADTLEVPTTSAALQQMLFAKLGTPQRRILEAMIQSYPHAMTKDALAERSDHSPTSGGYFNNLGRLRSLGLLDYPSPGHVAAQPVLFLE
jgi:hypothetical protein